MRHPFHCRIPEGQEWETWSETESDYMLASGSQISPRFQCRFHKISL